MKFFFILLVLFSLFFVQCGVGSASNPYVGFWRADLTEKPARTINSQLLLFLQQKGVKNLKLITVMSNGDYGFSDYKVDSGNIIINEKTFDVEQFGSGTDNISLTSKAYGQTLFLRKVNKSHEVQLVQKILDDFKQELSANQIGLPGISKTIREEIPWREIGLPEDLVTEGKYNASRASLKILGTTIDSYMYNNKKAPMVKTMAELEDLLVPFYIKKFAFHKKDAWGNEFIFVTREDDPGFYAIASSGADGDFKGVDQSGRYSEIGSNDIIYSNGKFTFAREGDD